MGRPRTLDDELELDLDLPGGGDEERDEHDTVGTADDTWDPDDDSDLGLDGLDGPEDIGLDAATGLDDGTDADLDLDESGEGEDWTADSEEADELADEDGDAGTDGDQEYGWLGDDEPPAEDDAFDPDLRDDEAPAMDDGGAEGLDDDSDLDGVDEASLPRLDSGADEDPLEDPSFEALDELSSAPAHDDTLIDIGGVQCRRLPERCVRSRPLDDGDGYAMVTPGLELQLDEDGALYRYACKLHDAAWWVVRSPVASTHEKPLAIAPLGDDVGEPLTLTATVVEGLVTLRVRGAHGGTVIEASLDGEDLA